MSADQLGDGRPQLPESEGQLTLLLSSLASTIDSTFNNYAFDLYVFGQHPVKIPSMEDLVDLFNLQRGVNWKPSGNVQNYSFLTKGVEEDFDAFDDQGKKVASGQLRIDLEDLYESGTSWSVIIKKSIVDSEKVSQFIYSETIEAKVQRNEDYRLDFVNSRGETCSIPYKGVAGVTVGKTGGLHYNNGTEDYAVSYHIPFFQRRGEDLTRHEVKLACTIVDTLYGITEKPNDPNLSSFLQEAEGSDENFNNMKKNLGLDIPNWHQTPINILRLNEIAQYLESRYRFCRGIDKTTFYEYQKRIAYLRNQLWTSSTRLVNHQFIFGNCVTVKQKINLTHLVTPPQCPYPDIAFPGNLCLTRCWLKFCPRGMGPFDPGLHNPSAPNDPRGRDPRGLFDPRGPR